MRPVSDREALPGPTRGEPKASREKFFGFQGVSALAIAGVVWLADRVRQNPRLSESEGGEKNAGMV